jgi:uncharacterized repeat protein (TIGR01451 family)
MSFKSPWKFLVLVVSVVLLGMIAFGRFGASPSLAEQAVAAFAPITATMTDTIENDNAGDGKIDPTNGNAGTTERIAYTATIANGGTDATNVRFTSALPGNLSLVPGSITVSPIAVDDQMPSIAGNTPISFTSAQLRSNDIDPDGDASTLAISGVSGASNGAIVNNGDGTVTFTPTTGYAGTASFQYTITDAQGVASLTTGLVSVNVTDRVWYVNNATGSDVTSDGSFTQPFATLAPLSTGDRPIHSTTQTIRFSSTTPVPTLTKASCLKRAKNYSATATFSAPTGST